jgi:hypothetical protein
MSVWVFQQLKPYASLLGQGFDVPENQNNANHLEDTHQGTRQFVHKRRRLLRVGGGGDIKNISSRL